MFAGGVAAAFVFYGTDYDGVKQRAGAHRGFARRVEIGVTGGFAGVGDQDDDAAAVVSATLQRARSQQDGIVDRSARARGHFVHRRLQGDHVVGKTGELRDVLGDGKDREAVAGAQNLLDEMSGGVLLEGDFLVG